jgi:hypothetical protein
LIASIVLVTVNESLSGEQMTIIDGFMLAAGYTAFSFLVAAVVGVIVLLSFLTYKVFCVLTGKKK